MPKLYQINFDQILAVLQNKIEDIFDPNTNKLRSPNHACWNDIRKLFNFHISSKYLYIIVKEDRRQIFTKLNITKENTCVQELSTSEIFEESSSKEDSDSSSSNKLNFKITLSKDEWKKIYDPKNIHMYKRSDEKNLIEPITL